jgi:histidinol dehydrogenase
MWWCVLTRPGSTKLVARVDHLVGRGGQFVAAAHRLDHAVAREQR